jgi:TPR repeat protein
VHSSSPPATFGRSWGRRFSKATSNLSRIDVPLLLNLSDRHYAPGLHFLGEMHEIGVAPFQRNLTKAREYFASAAENGYAEAFSSLSFYSRYGLGGPRDDSYAAICNTIASRSFSARSMLTLAARHSFGIDRPRSPRAASQAIIGLAVAICSGIDANDFPERAPQRLSLGLRLPSTRNSDRAQLAFIEHQAERGDAEAEVDLGIVYYDGNFGVDVDYARALELFGRHPDDPRATILLAQMKHIGRGVPKDVEGARVLYQARAAADDPNGMAGLGALQLEERDFEGASQWFRKAAARGHPAAAFNDASLRLEGKVSDSNFSDVYRDLKRLVHAGFAAALVNVAVVLLSGKHKFAEKRALQYLWKVVRKGPWNQVAEIAEDAFESRDYQTALHLWLELGDMGIETAAYNAAVMLTRWNVIAGPEPPLGFDEQQRLSVATRMFKMSYFMGYHQAFDGVVGCLMARRRDDQVFKWIQSNRTQSAYRPYLVAKLMLNAKEGSPLTRSFMHIKGNLTLAVQTRIMAVVPVSLLWAQMIGQYLAAIWEWKKGQMDGRQTADFVEFSRYLLEMATSPVVAFAFMLLLLSWLLRLRMALVAR